MLAFGALTLLVGLLPTRVEATVPTAGPSVVYFPATGHNVSGDLLQFWQENGGVDRIGNPITEEFKDGKAVRQYFERGVIEYTPASGVSLGRLGADAVSGRLDAPFLPLTRADFGADRDDRRFFPQVGHGITGPFARYWTENGDLTMLGFPLSEPLREAVGEKQEVLTVQYFERARLELAAGPDGETVRLGMLGREYAVRRGLAVEPVAKAAVAQEYSAALWPKWIDINLTTQRITAYEGNAQFLTYLTTSGKPGDETPTGVFQIFAKVKSERMRGDIGLPTEYDIKNVPWTMYFAGGGYAIHGAPWRSVFGPGTQAQGSRGCLNSPVDKAGALYQWAPLGTTVVIHF